MEVEGKKNVIESTDLTKWRLKNERGRQTWWYDASGELFGRESNIVELHSLGLDTSQEAPDLPRASTAREAARNGMLFYSKLQTEDGHWAGEYSGPHFLLPGLVIVCHVANTQLEEAQKKEMIRYLRNVQRQDGGWGLHVAGKSTVFGTVLNYVALRLLGVVREDSDVVRARALLQSLGGATGVPSWGKFFLALLGVYEWSGLNSLLPELWIMPTWMPFHPSNWWCQCRHAYLPMGYCYAERVRANHSQIISELREELYTVPYSIIDWPAQRNNIAPGDIYTPHSFALKVVFWISNVYERFHSRYLRSWAVSECLEQIKADDMFSHCISNGLVAKVIQMLVRWHAEGSQSPGFREHVDRIRDHLWIGRDGMKVQGTDGAQLWDATFATQAFIEASAVDDEQLEKCLIAAHQFFKVTQIPNNPPNYEKYYRHMCKGAFPFSTVDCGWIVSDCTAEGLKSVLLLQENCSSIQDPIEYKALCDCVDVLLSMQNSDGGYSTYEKKRSSALIELLNPAEVFGNIMIDYCSLECTSSCIQALKHFTDHNKYRKEDIRVCLSKAIRYILSNQRDDGSWEGSWGVCFTYGTWFGLEALAILGRSFEHGTAGQEVKKACQFLLSHQMEDGGWGEDFRSCEERRYIQSESSQIVNTCWALMGLMAVRYPDPRPIARGIKVIMERQLPNGDWNQEEIKGVFTRTCAITYTGYQNSFPIWTLGRFAKLYPDLNIFN